MSALVGNGWLGKHRHRSLVLLAVLGLALTGLAVNAGPSSARQLTMHSLSSTFTGGNKTEDIAVDEVTGDIYLVNRLNFGEGPGGLGGFPVEKFDETGTPASFTAPELGGATSMHLPPGGSIPYIAVDNSNTLTQGRIYVATGGGGGSGKLWAIEPSGTLVGGNFPVSNADGVTVDPQTGRIWVSRFGGLAAYTPTGEPAGAQIDLPNRPSGNIALPGDIGIDPNGDFYIVEPGSEGGLFKVSAAGQIQYFLVTNSTAPMSVDLVTGDVFNPKFIGGGYEIIQFSSTGGKLTNFGTMTGETLGITSNGASDTVYHAISDAGTVTVEVLSPSGSITIPDVTTTAVSQFEGSSMTVHGLVNPDGVPTTECYFEYGKTLSYGNEAPCAEGGVLSGTGNQAVSADLTGLTKGRTYHFRLVAVNAEGLNLGRDLTGVPSDSPVLNDTYVDEVHSDGAVLHGEIDGEGAATTVHFEYGLANCSSSSCTSTPPQQVPAQQSTAFTIADLQPATTYHYRAILTNQSGTTVGGDRTFTTFPLAPSFKDSCANSHVRQQTGAALLLDCRAYELVSASDTDGYNVESDLVSGQSPFSGYPEAEDRVLYGIHSGAIPGPWNPTNRGVDPYLATRGADGWSTDYAGLPADYSKTSNPFGSPLSEASPLLDRLAFGGNDICSPCFADGSTNVPLRMPDGSLIKGMAGSFNPAGDPSGVITKHFSADGSHFVFGSTAKFETDANSSGTDVTIYSRDLEADATQVVSTLPNGDTIANGAGVGALDISEDGSRVVVGSLMSTDPKGNHYYHLYMHVGNSPATIDLTPGTTTGALFGGMSADGSEVYFTTKDPLTTITNQDSDTSADLFRADVGVSSAALTRVSTGSGATGNTDSCNPASNSVNTNWNTVGGSADCSVTAIAGGRGVAAVSGDIYFLSPEKLDVSDPENQPVQNAPNLYLAKPGEAPRFVSSFESNQTLSSPAPTHHVLAGSFGSFENGTGTAIAPNGDVYVFDIGDGNPQVERYGPTGGFKSAIPGFGVTLSQESTGEALPTQIAVDALTGDLYVPDHPSSVERFQDNGTPYPSVPGSGFTLPTALAVNPANHDVYIGFGSVDVDSIGVFNPIETAQGVAFKIPDISSPRALAVDSIGRIYVAGRIGTYLYTPEGAFIRVVSPVASFGVAVDLSDDSVYVSEGDRILHFTSSGTPASAVEGATFTASRGLAVAPSGRLYVVESGKGGSVYYFDEEVASTLQTDNPAVVHATNDNGTRHTGDFQVSPDGRFAAFSSSLPLTGFDSRDHSEVFRYDATSEGINCPSCPSSTAAPSTDTTLAPHGLSLVDDGRVFFTTAEPLVVRDTNSKKDAYEWSDGSVQLVSTGASPFDSILLGASADGTDAHFFTRDTLVPQDENGTLTKIYDARAGGGFLNIPPPPPCRASDECHGAGSEAPAPSVVNTVTGSSGNENPPPKQCRRGFVKKRGKCMRKPRRGKKKQSSNRRTHRAD